MAVENPFVVDYEELPPWGACGLERSADMPQRRTARISATGTGARQTGARTATTRAAKTSC